VAIYPADPLLGLAAATFAFLLVGIGVGAAGTSLLVLLAKRADESRRGAAATVVWIMMIAGFIVTAATAGRLLDPYSASRLLAVSGTVSLIAFAVTCLAVWGVEKGAGPDAAPQQDNARHQPFGKTLAEVWRDPQARHFTIFVFVSMLAYSAQDLILEPFAGLAFGYTPGESTALSSIQNGGVLAGMVLVGALSSIFSRNRAASLRNWTAGGCTASAISLAGLAAAAAVGPEWPLKFSVFMLGFTNGIFAVAAIGCMFSYAVIGERREGMRMGLFGAAQAIAFGLGGFAGTAFADIARYATGSAAAGYGTVFALEALMFLAAAILALRIGAVSEGGRPLDNPLTLAARHQTQG
jgi:BCD family chlorophyll transporter-like MFS transporter